MTQGQADALWAVAYYRVWQLGVRSGATNEQAHFQATVDANEFVRDARQHAPTGQGPEGGDTSTT